MAADAPHPAFEPYAGESVPQAPVGAPGKEGVLELTFARSGGTTALVYDYATVPFHVSGTLGHDPHPEAAGVCVQSVAGGVVQGDRRDATVAVEPGGVAHVSTGSATKVHSMTRNYAAADAALSVGRDAHLDYVPEPTILHEDARLCRELTLEVAPGGSAVLVDVVVPGRLARGERFAFERYLSRVRATGPDGLLFEDTTHLVPAGTDPTVPGVLGEFDVYGTAFVVAPGDGTPVTSDDLHAVVSDRAGLAGATGLPNGAGTVVRALGDRAETVRETLTAAWDRARRALVDAPAPPRRSH